MASNALNGGAAGGNLEESASRVVFAVAVDAAVVAAALGGSRHRFDCVQVAGVPEVVAGAPQGHPALVVIGGEPAEAAATLDVLSENPALAGASFVAWPKDPTGHDVARLTALGARVALASAESLQRACEDSVRAREMRSGTVRVQAPVETEAVKLAGKRIVVADDDPAIVWFFADVLRSAGCEVDECSDGEAALDAARRTLPDLLLSDIRMPGLDGVQLAEALRADPLLADTPVVLLSWREDWLVDACRATRAAACLTKHATPEQTRARVSGALAEHTTFERRLQRPGSVRGALDKVSPYRLLRTACATRRNARITLRDTTHLYEIRLRDGAPRTATGVALDGTVVRGEEAFGAILAVRVGRYSVTSDSSPIEEELKGSWHDQIAGYLARVRGGDAGGWQQTIPMQVPQVDARAPSFELPRATATLVELPVRTLPLALRPLTRPAPAESTVRIVFPDVSARTAPATPVALRASRNPRVDSRPSPMKTTVAPRGSSRTTISLLSCAIVGAALLAGLAVSGERRPPDTAATGRASLQASPAARSEQRVATPQPRQP